MKTENILASIKSKSIKEAKKEINDILTKLESSDTDLKSSIKDYEKLIMLNKHIDDLFKKRVKEISNISKFFKNDKK
jgi:exonuclease VII small subunit